MNFASVTNQYYSKWIGEDSILKQDFQGVRFVYSSERNIVQPGYPQQSDLFLFYQNDRIVVSYGDKVSSKIDFIKNQIYSVLPFQEIERILKQLFGDCLKHHIKYVFHKPPSMPLLAKPLISSQYHQYLDFFLKINPNCKNTDWLYPYFIDMVNHYLCCGIFIDHILVSCSDAPDMPYLQDQVQEIGINTLQGYRGNGYAADVCLAAAQEIVKNGKCPQWSTASTNIASQKLAEKIGFSKLADVITITL